MFKKNLTPEARAAKANVKVGKALAVFSTAADELEKASEHHFDNAEALHLQADALEAQIEALRDQADEQDRRGFAVADHADTIRELAVI